MQTRIKVIREGGSVEELNLKGGVRGDLHTSDYLAPYGTLTSLGMGMIVGCTTAVAALVVIPTTTSLLTLFNGEAAGGLSYVIDRFFASGWAGDESHTGMSTLWACIHHSGQTMGNADLTIDTLDGDPYGGNAIADVGASVDNDVWYPWSLPQFSGDMDTFTGQSLNYDVQGRIVIKPTYAVSLHVVSADADQTWKVGLSWHEVQIDVA